MSCLIVEDKPKPKYYVAKYVERIPIPNFDYNYYMTITGIIKHKCDKSRVATYECDGRMFALMYDNNGKRRTKVNVAKLVAETLLPPPARDWYHLRFRDNDQLNYNPNNLYWSPTKHNYSKRHWRDKETGLVYYTRKVAIKHLRLTKYSLKKRLEPVYFKKFMKVIRK